MCGAHSARPAKWYVAVSEVRSYGIEHGINGIIRVQF